MPVGIITGASRGLGLALARSLAERAGAWSWTHAGGDALDQAWGGTPGVVALPGDVADERHRRALVEAAGERIDLLVNNASVLGPSPQPPLARLPARRASAASTRSTSRRRSRSCSSRSHAWPSGARILNVTSDAAVEAYEGWGGYGSAKAALEQLSAVLGAEHPELRVYAVDPGDMRTRMHQEAFPDEDISDRPPPGRQRAGPARSRRGDAAERPLPRPGARGSRLVSTLAATAAATLPEPAEASRPPEARGLGRDDVRLLVASHDRLAARPVSPIFRTCSTPGDLLVVNTSRTLPASLPGPARRRNRAYRQSLDPGSLR